MKRRNKFLTGASLEGSEAAVNVADSVVLTHIAEAGAVARPSTIDRTYAEQECDELAAEQPPLKAASGEAASRKDDVRAACLYYPAAKAREVSAGTARQVNREVETVTGSAEALMKLAQLSGQFYEQILTAYEIGAANPIARLQ